MKTGAKVTLACVGLVFIGGFALNGCVSRDMGYHCDFTGSTKSWTTWLFTIRTNYEYNASPLESFLEENAPDRIEHNWVSYQGTGRNIFGEPVLFGHGRPNALLLFPRDYLKLYIEESPPESVFELYETLLRDDSDEIRLRVERLYDESDRLLRNRAEQAGDRKPNLAAS